MRTVLTIGVAAALALALGSPVQAAPVPGPARAITDPKSIVSEQRPATPPVAIPALYDNRASLGAAWSPDGKWVVVSANLTGRYNLWKYPAAGGAPVQLTHSDDRQSGIAISPDGKWVVFQSDHGGDEMYDLCAVPLAGGEVVDLTNTPTVSETDAYFSPDGKQLAFAAKPKTSPITNVAVMDMATHAVRALTHEPSLDNGWRPAAWTPDGKAVIANRQDVGSTVGSVWRLSLAGAAPKQLSQGKARISASDISRDGRRLSITSNQKGGIDQAALLDVASGKLTWLSPSPWEQEAGSFSPDAASVTILTNADGRADLSAYDLKAGKVRKLPLPAGFNAPAGGAGGPFARDGRMLVGHDASNTPFDYWVLSKGGQARRLTDFAAKGLDPAKLPVSHIVHYKSFDGTVISAILMVPFNLKRDGAAPGVVVPHGGPTGQTTDRFSRLAVALASRGYLVIQPNPRGSTGYGEAFQKANHADLGGGDLTDEVYAAKFLAATGYANPKKIGITGGSYGGFMTLMAVGKTPDVWAAAVSMYGIINWFEMLKHEDAALQAYERSLIGDPVADKAVYDADSPMTYIRHAKAPLLVLQGENDIRVPRGQAAEVVATLKSVGATVDVHYYPQEGHGFAKRENQIDSLQRTIDWFDKYLK
ncbi:MAG TPA: S9 family peptidase [Phenylobacterium sp.]|jgi:dipeptidyl aminopeptidase/acylaminoacyl peptidase|uniref:S9 family peptidase n=1 Tax=Phenylobacterium sp. TaxID=1871053 RepID=UPI002D2A4183|nr:S9 family peptidase [Phenylobacterium sp.]HZZ67956.1 S9 family peptidase [Phenylobacterium sp.]